MFEQSVIPRSSKGKRVWTTCVGVTGQVLLVTAMVLAPMLWPQVMPQASYMLVVPHAPMGRRAKGNAEAKPQGHVAHRKYILTSGMVQPRSVPSTITPGNDIQITDPGPAGDPYGVVGGDPNGTNDGVMGLLTRDGELAARPTPPPRVVEPPKPAAEPVIRRIKPGGVVREPRLVYRVEPKYPPLAKAARVQGVVQLHGVIATSGRLMEISVESGNPLLAPAALEAVRQWRYEPTLLNGDPVELVTTITVTFVLSR